MDKEVNQVLNELNIKLKEFHQYYPKTDWSKKTKEDLILNFTFHTNKIEGLTFSYGETISFLKNGLLENRLLTQPAVMADVSMLQNHQKALSLIFEHYEKGEISTSYISKIHQAILTTGTFKDDEINPGYYRGDDICVKKPNGELKYFLIDNKIPEAMKDLVSRTNGRITKADFKTIENHPFVIAVDMHVDFLNIHPFRDGNGRTARLLMNLINMKFKIPPFSPKSDQEERIKYYEAFDKVDIAKSNFPMVEFLGKQLLEILENSIEKAKKIDRNQRGGM